MPSLPEDGTEAIVDAFTVVLKLSSRNVCCPGVPSANTGGGTLYAAAPVAPAGTGTPFSGTVGYGVGLTGA